MEITISIQPSGVLSPDQFAKIGERAAARNQTPESFVVDAILAALTPTPTRRKAAKRKEVA